MCLAALPHEILAMIAAELPLCDVIALVTALLDAPANLGSLAQAAHLPRDLHRHWAQQHGAASLATALHALEGEAYWHARQWAGALAVVDWSPFTSHKVPVVADYNMQYGRATTAIRSDEVIRAVNQCLSMGRCGMRISLHLYFMWGGQLVMQPQAVCHHLHYAVPPTVAAA